MQTNPSAWLQFLSAVFVAALASNGLWAFIQMRNEKKDARTQMLIGLGHDRIIYLGMHYLERGDWITEEEYENLVVYLYEPYAKCGGNGSAERVIAAVKQLRIVKTPPKEAEHEKRESTAPCTSKEA